MLCSLFAASSSHLWWSEKSENIDSVKPYFENLKHLQNPGTLTMTASCMCNNPSITLKIDIFLCDTLKLIKFIINIQRTSSIDR